STLSGATKAPGDLRKPYAIRDCGVSPGGCEGVAPALGASRLFLVHDCGARPDAASGELADGHRAGEVAPHCVLAPYEDEQGSVARPFPSGARLSLELQEQPPSLRGLLQILVGLKRRLELPELACPPRRDLAP